MARTRTVTGYWRQLVAEQEHSGQSVREFCKERRVSHSYFYENRRWIQIIANRELEDANHIPEADRVEEAVAVEREACARIAEEFQVNTIPGTSREHQPNWCETSRYIARQIMSRFK